MFRRALSARVAHKFGPARCPRLRRVGFRRLIPVTVLLAAVLVAPQPAYAAFSHSRSMRTEQAFAGATAAMSTTGMGLTGPMDWHEMSLTLYAPSNYTNGSAIRPTLAIAIGRSNGYNSWPAHNLHDGVLRAYTLSTFAPGDVENDREFVYAGGRVHPVEILPDKDYQVVLQYTGERRWIYYAALKSSAVRGKSAHWADGRGHWAYRWVGRLNGVQIADCWFNAPVALIKYECNHVRAERVKSMSTFKDLRVRDYPSSLYRPLPPSTRFALHSNYGYYLSWSTAYTRTTFALGAARMLMTQTKLTPLTGRGATVSGVLRDAVNDSPLRYVPVTMVRSTNGGRTWSPFATLRTNAGGGVSRVVPSAGSMDYRFVSGSDVLHYPATSAVCTVRASDQLTLGYVPAVKARTATFSIAATLLPSHWGVVVVTADRLEGGVWRARRTATLRRQADGTTYRGSLGLGLAGRWRVRAYHSKVGAATVYSRYKLVVAN